MDLSKAFDCVDQKIFKRYGFHATTLQWIYSSLSDREHFILWNQTHSPEPQPSLNLNIGVPQCSILWPRLFLIYINDIINSIHILSFVLFFNDQHDSIDGAIQILDSELAKVAECFDSNKLSLTYP